jgi:hypothetical protein
MKSCGFYQELINASTRDGGKRLAPATAISFHRLPFRRVGKTCVFMQTTVSNFAVPGQAQQLQ